MEFPKDKIVRDLSDQYMFGSALMVAPITLPENSREVYLPSQEPNEGGSVHSASGGGTIVGRGSFVDFWNGTSYSVEDGGRTVSVVAGLDRIPLFGRGV